MIKHHLFLLDTYPIPHMSIWSDSLFTIWSDNFYAKIFTFPSLSYSIPYGSFLFINIKITPICYDEHKGMYIKNSFLNFIKALSYYFASYSIWFYLLSSYVFGCSACGSLLWGFFRFYFFTGTWVVETFFFYAKPKII